MPDEVDDGLNGELSVTVSHVSWIVEPRIQQTFHVRTFLQPHFGMDVRVPHLSQDFELLEKLEKFGRSLLRVG